MVCAVAAQRLLDHHARARSAAGTAEAGRDLGEQARRDGEVMAGTPRAIESGAQGRESRLVAVVAVHDPQLLRES